jgi:hypothetical protein
MPNANIGISQAGYNVANNIPNVASTGADLTKQGFMGDIRSTFGTKPEYSMGSVGEGASNALKDPIGFFKGPGSWQDAATVASPFLMAAMKPPEYKPYEDKSYQMKYEGPYSAQDRERRMPTMEEQATLREQGSPEYSYFGNTNPYPGFNKAPGYADGGLTSLYETQDNMPAPNLSQDGYGLGRLQAMTQGGMPSYAGGGAIAFDAGGTVPYMGGAPSYGIAPTDLSQVAGIPNVGGTDPSSDSGLKGILGNMITDPLGRTAGGMNGKGGAQSTGANLFAAAQNNPSNPRSVLNAFMNPGGQNAPQAPRALTMQDYINSAARVYNPAASAQTINNAGAPEMAQFNNINPQQPVMKAMGGGIHGLKSGGRPMPGGYLDGAGDGMSDSIPATIGDKQPARLADGEFVIPADVVSHMGNGSTKAGAQHLYKVMDKVRKARTGTKKQGKQINPNRFMTA